MRSPWIAYVHTMLFPYGQAGSRRVYGNALSLLEAGYDVAVASGSDSPRHLETLEHRADGGRLLFHEGLDTLPKQRDRLAKRARELLFASGPRTVKWLSRQPTKPSHVILYGGYTPYMLRLLPWCRRHGVTLIADLVEWYEPGSLGRLGLRNLNSYLAMEHLFQRADGIIAISSFLETFYRQRGCVVTRVPPTLDVREVTLPTRDQDASARPLRLIYAGNPGAKDLLRPVLEALSMADPGGHRFELVVLGPSLEQVRAHCPGRQLSAGVRVLGRVPQEDVAAHLQRADFSVLLREPRRMTEAGFPTKFVESLACGVPVIANLTSDLARFLRDGQEGLVCSGYSAADFSEVLERASKLRSSELTEMRQAARRTAESAFDYRNYTDTLRTLIERTRR
jgi:glycosyltransferase involved in cell wall biosynthesis